MKLQNCIDSFRTNRQIEGKVIPQRNKPIQSFITADTRFFKVKVL